MLPEKELRQIEREKQILVAHNDRLRGECGDIWSAMGRRIEVVEDGFGRLRWLPPALSFLSMAGLLYLRKRGLHGKSAKVLQPVLSIANQAMNLSRGSSADKKPPRDV